MTNTRERSRAVVSTVIQVRTDGLGIHYGTVDRIKSQSFLTGPLHPVNAVLSRFMYRTLALLSLVLIGVSASHFDTLKRGKHFDKRATTTSCACGYRDSNGNLWRESVTSDFTSSAGAMSVLSKDWYVETWGTQKKYQYMQCSASNVFQYQNALGLKTSAYTGNNKTYVGEIQSHRSDILYGTFRMNAQVPTVPGVCFGFFAYRTSTQETDIEFLSSDLSYYNTVHYANQPYTTARSSQKVQVNGDLRTPGVHRFDWLPSQTMFYYNNQQMASITIDVSSTASNVLLNVWSDGDPTWSHGPPMSDAIGTVRSVQMYFNSTTMSESSFTAGCTAAGKPAVCQI
ncbi:glycoside hydrolase family 16 protein [Neolentinus lepideus HHB14362 ss-1]|uniref:Glycoside hydrolase family 16 protein n=1 Tax=Neolentinus lepideus HHB14362 ss-1 TaxID=1314782 RepID=A0A165VEJ7_9AGAM|nr:glycoside hydrolase family 16 protein [Neolentinus lepideus HHB14362 ss-1]